MPSAPEIRFPKTRLGTKASRGTKKCEATKKQGSVALNNQGAGDTLLYLGSASRPSVYHSSPPVTSPLEHNPHHLFPSYDFSPLYIASLTLPSILPRPSLAQLDTPLLLPLRHFLPTVFIDPLLSTLLIPPLMSYRRPLTYTQMVVIAVLWLALVIWILIGSTRLDGLTLLTLLASGVLVFYPIIKSYRQRK